MSKSCIQEIDFFQMEKLREALSKPSPPAATCGSSSRGIQSLVSRINPQLLKTVMAAGQARSTSDNIFPPANGQLPSPSNPPSPTVASSAPLTIFYNGAVITLADVPRDKAEAIMRMAEIAGEPVKWPAPESLLHGDQMEGDLPMARRKSLHRFLEKRKLRLASSSPYSYQKISTWHLRCDTWEETEREGIDESHVAREEIGKCMKRPTGGFHVRRSLFQ